MKSKLIKMAFVIAIAVLGGINVFNAQQSETLSDVALANVEALAELEGDKPGSGTIKPCLEVCYENNGWMCTRIYNGETSRCVHYRLKPEYQN